MTAPQGGQAGIYRSLLRLYPADYRAAYGAQMVQLFGDQLRDSGSATTWMQTLVDLPRTAISEQLRRKRTVAHSMSLAPGPGMRTLGILGVMGGLVTLAAFLPVWPSSDLFNLRLVLLNVGAIAVVIAVHRRQAPAGRFLALTGAIPALLANLAYLVLIFQLVAQPGDIGRGDYGPGHAYLQGAMWVTNLWFALVTLRLGVVSRIASLTLVIGSVSTIIGLGIFVPTAPGTTLYNAVLAGWVVFGLGWILLGIDVAFRRRPSVHSSEAA